ncbi:MAG: hypothetical protein HC850_13760 [Rhodomicrobium sp.]|nr:hypothetical protein [Rhodomicrobium sp.]
MSTVDPFSDWRRAWLEAHDAGVTILMRALSIQRAFLRGDFTGGPETRSMVAEKLIAAQQGMGEATLASLKSIARRRNRRRRRSRPLKKSRARRQNRRRKRSAATPSG